MDVIRRVADVMVIVVVVGRALLWRSIFKNSAPLGIYFA